jgi:photosystem II stability/assembly factor-like uncharacterized protein
MKTIFFVLFAVLTILNINTHSQWVYQQTPSNASYYVCIDFPNAQTGIAGGVELNPWFSGRGAYTTNGGSNWHASQAPDSLRVMVEIKFINSLTGYCAGAYNLAGYRYQADPGRYDRRTLRSLTPARFGDDDYKGLFLKTTNSGQSWFTYGSLPANVYYLLGLSFVNSTTGFALAAYDYSGGVNDGVIKTTNAGLNWFVLPMPENINSVSDIHFIDLNTGFVVGYDEVNDTARAVILKTTNSGSNWSRQIFMQLRDFSGIYFSNSLTGLVISSSDPVIEPVDNRTYKTTNSGSNWFLNSTFDDAILYGVKSVVGTGVYLIFGSRLLPSFEYMEFFAKTTNYGFNWSQGSLNDTGLVLVDAKLLDQNNWYMTGGNLISQSYPVILHTTNGGTIGIVPIGPEVPKYYLLYQNYPNPFNPETKIKFAIPSSGGVNSTSGNVTLKVFDILGKEVVVLVDENLTTGIYEVTFDASKLTSGIYFYRINAGEYTETKRMMLIK